MRLTGRLFDANNSAGSSGQVLQTTGVGTDWVDASSLSDGDWTVSGSEMYNTAPITEVGINTTSPAAELDVRRNNAMINSQIFNNVKRNEGYYDHGNGGTRRRYRTSNNRGVSPRRYGLYEGGCVRRACRMAEYRS